MADLPNRKRQSPMSLVQQLRQPSLIPAALQMLIDHSRPFGPFGATSVRTLETIGENSIFKQRSKTLATTRAARSPLLNEILNQAVLFAQPARPQQPI
jgi:hypothetical protein